MPFDENALVGDWREQVLHYRDKGVSINREIAFAVAVADLLQLPDDLHEKDEPLPAAPQLQDLTPADLAESDSTDISYIGPGMTVVGKISSKGILNVLGRVEGFYQRTMVHC
jgi:hypothetical protein